MARRERKKTVAHLGNAFGEKTSSELETLGRRVFVHYARVAVDVLRFPQLTQENLNLMVNSGDGLGRLNALYKEGKGIIILTAHLGNWELMGAYLRLNGCRGAVIGRKIYYEKFNQVLLEMRGRIGLQTIFQDAPAKEFLKVLKRNEMLGILADQDVDRLDGIFIPFFGKPAYTLTSPVKLALVTEAPIVPTFLVREGDRYRLLVDEPIRVEMKGTREETIEEYTRKWSQRVEDKIRKYPDQWVWMHRRWKTQPPVPEQGVLANQ